MTERQLEDRILDAFGEDRDFRFVRSYRASVIDDTGVAPPDAVSSEVVTSLEFLEELLTAYEGRLSNARELAEYRRAERERHIDEGTKRREVLQGQSEMDRTERIAKAQEARNRAVISQSPRCIACGKKPRSIDDYCKKCAREAGIVVHGKIGGS